MEKILKTLFIIILISLLGYSIIGTDSRVASIKVLAPTEMQKRNWEILRYEGYQQGSWWNHGGKVWYHVANTDNRNIQYRVFVTQWKGELHFSYGEPEVLNRIDFQSK